MTQRTFLAVATAAFVLHAAVMLSMIVRREVTLSRGELFRFRTAPVDPHDAFRGKYVSVDVQGAGPFTNRVEFRRGQRLYGALEVDQSGIASISAIHPAVPTDAPYITLRCEYSRLEQVKSGVETNVMYYGRHKGSGRTRWYSRQEVDRDTIEYTRARTNTVDRYKFTGSYLTTVTMPFDRYYLDEEMAPDAERLYRENSLRGRQEAVLKVRIRRGYALIESLEIGGVPIRELIRREE